MGALCEALNFCSRGIFDLHSVPCSYYTFSQLLSYLITSVLGCTTYDLTVHSLRVVASNNGPAAIYCVEMMCTQVVLGRLHTVTEQFFVCQPLRSPVRWQLDNGCTVAQIADVRLKKGPISQICV